MVCRMAGIVLQEICVENILAVRYQVLHLVQQCVGAEIRIGKVERVVAGKAPEPYVFAAGAAPVFQ